jgi:hypothetical protein
MSVFSENSNPKSLDCEEAGLGEMNYYNGGVNFTLPQHLRHDDSTDSDASSDDSEHSRVSSMESSNLFAKRSGRNCKKTAFFVVVVVLILGVGAAIFIPKLLKGKESARGEQLQQDVEAEPGKAAVINEFEHNVGDVGVSALSAGKDAEETNTENEPSKSTSSLQEMELSNGSNATRPELAPLEMGGPEAETGKLPERPRNWKKYAAAVGIAATVAGGLGLYHYDGWLPSQAGADSIDGVPTSFGPTLTEGIASTADTVAEGTMRLDKIPPTHRTMRPDKIEPTHPETAPTLPDWVRNTGVCPTRAEFDQFVDKEGRGFRSRIDPQLVNGKGPLDCNKARTLAAVPTNVLETAYNGCELGEGAHPLACDDQRALRSAVEHADPTSAKKKWSPCGQTGLIGMTLSAKNAMT